MITVHKMTLEDLIKKTLEEDPSAAGTILRVPDGSNFRMTLTFAQEVPANFAKAVLADHLRDQADKLQASARKGGA